MPMNIDLTAMPEITSVVLGKMCASCVSNLLLPGFYLVPALEPLDEKRLFLALPLGLNGNIRIYPFHLTKKIGLNIIE